MKKKSAIGKTDICTIGQSLKGLGSIPAGRPAADECFPAITGLNYDMCINYSLELYNIKGNAKKS